MGGRAGGGAGGGIIGNDTTYKGEIKNVESLVHMKDPKMYKATKEAIARYAAVIGVPERNVKLADLEGPVMGIGAKGGVYLNKAYFNRTSAQMAMVMKNAYESGHLTKTNKPLAHVVTHELAHATWTSDMKANKAATAAITRLYKQWSKDSRKTGYGTYAKSNVDEFWAETVTKAVYGTQDKYTRAVKNIVKKYKL